MNKKSFSVQDLVTQKTIDRLKVFIMSWNMGNAEAEGLENVFSEKNATNDFDVIVLGLQESTYSMKGSSSSDCVAHLGSLIESTIGPNYFKASLTSIFINVYNFFIVDICNVSMHFHDLASCCRS
jgi:hypothetical protein